MVTVRLDFALSSYRPTLLFILPRTTGRLMLPSSLSVTTSTLLESLFAKEDPETWQVFDARLRPVLLGVAARMGLSTADAQDAAQECLAQVVASGRAGRYDRHKGRLRTWILAVLKNRVRDVHRRRRAAPLQATDSSLGRLPGDAALERLWDEESRSQRHGLSLAAINGRPGVRPRSRRRCSTGTQCRLGPSLG